MNKNNVILLFRILVCIGAIWVGSAYFSSVTEQKGVVTGILYIVDNSSAIIDGQIVYEKDTIYDVDVVKIEKFTVEFQKGGIRWKQRVREKPNPAWEKTD